MLDKCKGHEVIEIYKGSDMCQFCFINVLKLKTMTNKKWLVSTTSKRNCTEIFNHLHFIVLLPSALFNVNCYKMKPWHVFGENLTHLNSVLSHF